MADRMGIDIVLPKVSPQPYTHAVPTFVIGDTTIAGVRSKETLEQIIKDEMDKQKPQMLMEGMTCGIDGC